MQAIISIDLSEEPEVEFDEVTGHVIGCEQNWRDERTESRCSQRGKDGITQHLNYQSKQCCVVPGGHGSQCPLCHAEQCKAGESDKDLSGCANLKATVLGLDYNDRLRINQKNIKSILGLPLGYNHISDARMKKVRLNDESSDSSSDESVDTTTRQLPARNAKRAANNRIDSLYAKRRCLISDESTDESTDHNDDSTDHNDNVADVQGDLYGFIDYDSREDSV